MQWLQQKKSNIVSVKLLDDDGDNDEDATENDRNNEFDLLNDQEIPLIVVVIFGHFRFSETYTYLTAPIVNLFLWSL